MEASLKRKTVKQTANARSRFIDAERPVAQWHDLFALLITRMKDGGTRSFRYEPGMAREGDAQAV